MKQLGQYAAPRHVIAHLSDPHLIADGGLHYGVVDNVANLRRALDRLAAVRPAPQALVFTGDLADQAAPDAYATLRSIVEPAAAEMGAIVVWTMGNHDERAPFAAGLFDSADDGFQDRVHEVDGLRIVALDTSVPGYHHGELRPEQLAWLADVLATPAEHGTLLAMHHPPLPLPMLRAAELIELHDQQALADVIAGTRRARASSRATCTCRRGRPSPACRCRWRRPAATPATPHRSTASSPASTPPRPSRWSTPTTTGWCTPSSRSSAAPR